MVFSAPFYRWKYWATCQVTCPISIASKWWSQILTSGCLAAVSVFCFLMETARKWRRPLFCPHGKEFLTLNNTCTFIKSSYGPGDMLRSLQILPLQTSRQPVKYVFISASTLQKQKLRLGGSTWQSWVMWFFRGIARIQVQMCLPDFRVWPPISVSGWLSSTLGFLGRVRNKILSVFVEYSFYGIRETWIFCKNSILKLNYLLSSSTCQVTVLFFFFLSFLNS